MPDDDGQTSIRRSLETSLCLLYGAFEGRLRKRGDLRLPRDQASFPFREKFRIGICPQEIQLPTSGSCSRLHPAPPGSLRRTELLWPLDMRLPDPSEHSSVDCWRAGRSWLRSARNRGLTHSENPGVAGRSPAAEHSRPPAPDITPALAAR